MVVALKGVRAVLKRFLTDALGNVYLNDQKRFGKGCIVVPAEANNPVITTAGSAAVPTQSKPIMIEGAQEAVTELFSFVGAHGAADNADVQARLAVQITDTAYRRRLMNRYILANHVFGSAQRPYRLLKTTILDSQQTLMFEFQNPSAGGSSNFRLAFEGRKFQRYGTGTRLAEAFLADKRKEMSYLYPYWLTHENTVTLTASGLSDIWFQNTSDQWLLIGKIMATSISSGAAGNEHDEAFTFDLWDPKSERLLMNQPVTMNCGTGTAQFPYHLDPPLLIEPNTRMHMRLTSLITNVSQEVFITLGGVGCYSGAALFAPAMQNQPVGAGLAPGGVTF
jgi:hypothetical protein